MESGGILEFPIGCRPRSTPSARRWSARAEWGDHLGHMGRVREVTVASASFWFVSSCLDLAATLSGRVWAEGRHALLVAAASYAGGTRAIDSGQQTGVIWSAVN